ncbi:hypothetical protein M8J77_021974 [Diaphorina citri]|nr:hypothetical protein M8J77_021974 [Diaphorina citri]
MRPASQAVGVGAPPCTVAPSRSTQAQPKSRAFPFQVAVHLGRSSDKDRSKCALKRRDPRPSRSGRKTKAAAAVHKRRPRRLEARLG